MFVNKVFNFKLIQKLFQKLYKNFCKLFNNNLLFTLFIIIFIILLLNILINIDFFKNLDMYFKYPNKSKIIEKLTNDELDAYIPSSPGPKIYTDYKVCKFNGDLQATGNESNQRLQGARQSQETQGENSATDFNDYTAEPSSE